MGLVLLRYGRDRRYRCASLNIYLALAVHVHKLGEVKAGPLHHLHLPDVHVVQGVDALKGEKHSSHPSVINFAKFLIGNDNKGTRVVDIFRPRIVNRFAEKSTKMPQNFITLMICNFCFPLLF